MAYTKDEEDNVWHTKLVDKVEQLRDMWDGQETYDDDQEWLDNVEAALRDLQNFMGL